VTQLLAVISADLGRSVRKSTEFVQSEKHTRLFDRSRLTFYHAEGLKELARDQMADERFFDTLLGVNLSTRCIIGIPASRTATNG
jgi:hypothetical protein